MDQKTYLNNVKKALGMTWDELASAANISPRALKTYRMPTESKDYRTMPPLAYGAIERVRESRK